ncbi:prephenate dehydrogenase/arogenate dehydrogenase family protein [Microbispora corallina]|uniref:Prephenate dehydrogenase n=1 Tax=Microbispora corallina TaxID=83302 RepID=A0ABQ4G1W7_9ACTN|nr:prephenate dehydrogenase/arogenate dehydrogenase family protein [Microbispora corallina]GIH41046.1 prephenate dehydrogenase [Microbispora corallina]
MDAPGALRRCVVVGGAGAVGGLFADRLLRSGADVLVVDAAAPLPGRLPGARFLKGDVTAPDGGLAAEFGRADLVLLAVPEPVALTAAAGVAAAMRPGALLADTLSVKGPIVREVRARAAAVEAVALNPMFAPSLGFEGRPVAAVVVHDGPRARTLLDLVGSWGGRVVLVREDEHDRLAAATQALTHAAVLAFGLALDRLGVGVAELAAVAPPPHATLLALLARIASGTPEVYWDVQAANPQAPAAREALAAGVRDLSALVEGEGEERFAAALGSLRELLGPDLGFYRDMCARMFGGMSSYDPDALSTHVSEPSVMTER